MTLRSGILRLVAGIAITALAVLVQAEPSGADPSPFDTLLGSWGGSGQIRLDKGREERLKCNAYYTGGGAAARHGHPLPERQLQDRDPQQAQLVAAAASPATGKSAPSMRKAMPRVRPRATRSASQISGGVTGTMLVSYTESRQSVAISTQGVALQSVTITLWAELVSPLCFAALESGLAFLEDEVSMAELRRCR